MQTNCITQAVRPQKMKILWRTPLYTVYVSCTRRLVVQCRRQLYNENWNNIYSVTVVNFSISVSFFFNFYSVFVIVNEMKFYPLTEWIHFRYSWLKSHSPRRGLTFEVSVWTLTCLNHSSELSSGLCHVGWYEVVEGQMTMQDWENSIKNVVAVKCRTGKRRTNAPGGNCITTQTKTSWIKIARNHCA